MPDRSESIETLRQRSERCRAELRQTIGELSGTLSQTTDEIRTTLSPHNLKQEARAYAREKRAAAGAAVRDHVESNPLQALAIGAAVSYPLLGIARKVPVPLVLIGAGLLLSRNRPSATSSRSALSSDSAEMRRVAEEEETGGSIRPGLDENLTGAASAESMADEAARAASGVSGRRSRKFDGAARSSRLGAADGNTVRSVIERNPLLVGGLAMAVGGIIAASLPALRAEEQVLGQVRGAVKNKTRKAAADAVRGARARAAEVADDISAAAEKQGLTPEALGGAVDAATDKAAAVVTRAVDEALGPEPAAQSSQTETDGGPNAKR